MVEKNQPGNAVKNVYKNGRMPTKEEYTKVWIDLINKIEREKASQQKQIIEEEKHESSNLLQAFC